MYTAAIQGIIMLCGLCTKEMIFPDFESERILNGFQFFLVRINYKNRVLIISHRSLVLATFPERRAQNVSPEA